MSAPIPPIMVDDRESDLAYFRRHPGAQHRFRHPLPDEFPAATLNEARIQAAGREVVVLVVVDRDSGTRARGLICLPGGSA